MRAHVLLNLLNELGKRDKMRDLIILKSDFCRKTLFFLSLCTQQFKGSLGSKF